MVFLTVLLCQLNGPLPAKDPFFTRLSFTSSYRPLCIKVTGIEGVYARGVTASQGRGTVGMVESTCLIELCSKFGFKGVPCYFTVICRGMVDVVEAPVSGDCDDGEPFF